MASHNATNDTTRTPEATDRLDPKQFGNCSRNLAAYTASSL